MPDTTQFGDHDDSFVEGSLSANTILMNRYKVLGMLGGGGQGAVYQGRDLNFPDAKRLVAIKEMHYPSGDPSVRSVTMATFQREANILATLNHPAIPKIFDFFDQNHRAYLVMEYINGNDLELLLSKTKQLPIDKIIEWAIDLCDVLHYLHGHQPEPIVFRDMKPANVMVDSLGKIRLIDFGIAKVFVSGVKHTMIGTEGYSAPEQYKGNVTPLSDIYSLGATLHHIITRKDPRLEPPFSFNERPIQQFNDTVPDGLVSIIDRSLAMEPRDRFPNCGAMKDALEQLRYRPVSAATTKSGERKSSTDPFGGGTELLDEQEGGFGAFEPRWVFKSEDEIRCSPTSYKGIVFTGSYDTNVWAINQDTGELRWKYATGGGIASSPVVDGFTKLVMFGSEDYTFYAVDIVSGQIMWTYGTNDRIRSSPTIAQEHVFFGSDDGHLYALVTGNGRFMWEYDMGAPIRSKPYVSEEQIIVGSESGELVAVGLSGTRKWTYRLKKPLTAAPFVDEPEQICYVGCFDGYMYSFDAATGYSLWRFRTNGPIVSSVVLDKGILYFGSTDSFFYAVNAENAKEKWRFNTEKPIVGSPIMHGDYLYFGDTGGTFYCVESKNGKETWRFKAGGPITSAAHIAEDFIFVGSMDHTLYALPLVGGHK